VNVSATVVALPATPTTLTTAGTSAPMLFVGDGTVLGARGVAAARHRDVEERARHRAPGSAARRRVGDRADRSGGRLPVFGAHATLTADQLTIYSM